MLHLPLWQHPQHRIAEQACQPLPAFLLKPWHTAARQKRSNAHYSIFFTQFILMSAYPFSISTSLSLAACACCLLSLQSDGTTVFPTSAYAHFSSHLIISSFSPLSSLSCLQTSFSVLPVIGEPQLPLPLPSSEPASHSLLTSCPFIS